MNRHAQEELPVIGTISTNPPSETEKCKLSDFRDTQIV